MASRIEPGACVEVINPQGRNEGELRFFLPRRPGETDKELLDRLTEASVLMVRAANQAADAQPNSTTFTDTEGS